MKIIIHQKRSRVSKFSQLQKFINNSKIQPLYQSNRASNKRIDWISEELFLLTSIAADIKNHYYYNFFLRNILKAFEEKLSRVLPDAYLVTACWLYRNYCFKCISRNTRGLCRVPPTESGSDLLYSPTLYTHRYSRQSFLIGSQKIYRNRRRWRIVMTFVRGHSLHTLLRYIFFYHYYYHY